MGNEVEEGKVCAALAYLFPIGLIWYLVDDKMKKNKFVAYHVYQSLAAAIVMIALWIVVSIIGSILLVTIVLAPLAVAIWGIVSLIGLVWFIQGLINALTGKQSPLFVIGKIGDKFHF